MIDVLSAAEKYGRREGSLWRFDDLGLSLFAGAVLGLYEAAQNQKPVATENRTIEEDSSRGVFLYIENPHP